MKSYWRVRFCILMVVVVGIERKRMILLDMIVVFIEKKKRKKS